MAEPRAAKAAGVSWQQPLMMAAMMGISAVKNLNENRPLNRSLFQAAGQAMQKYSERTALLTAPTGSDGFEFKYGPPADDGEVALSLMELAPDGCPKLNVRVIMAADREDFSGKSYVAFLVLCRFGEQQWTLEKRFSKFHALHEQLVGLLGRDLAARLPPLPTRLPSILGQNLGRGPREVQERRHKLDLVVKRGGADRDLSEGLGDKAHPNHPDLVS